MSIPFKQCNERNYRKGREFPINWICLHFTSGNGDTAQNNADYFAREGGLNASAHYFVDTERIMQSVKDGDTAWHCGRERGGSYYNDCRNANSIGIEMCSVIRNGVYVIPEATMQNAAKLTRALMAKYHVPVSRVCRHYDVTRKNCPEPWIRNPQLWEKFKTMLTEKEVEDDSEDYSLFSTDTMRFYLLEDGKLCFTTGDDLDAEAADAETEEDDDSMDWTIKVYFDKLVVE